VTHNIEGNGSSREIKCGFTHNVPALAENESVVKNESDSERKAIALAWLFHLVGDNPSYDVLPECSVLVGRRGKAI